MDNDIQSKLANSMILTNPDFEFKLLRQFGLITYGGATFGECYKAAKSMLEWDLPEWAAQWAALAAEVESTAEECLEKGHKVSASEAFLRAANYYHAAEYYALIANGDHAHFGMQCEIYPNFVDERFSDVS